MTLEVTRVPKSEASFCTGVHGCNQTLAGRRSRSEEGEGGGFEVAAMAEPTTQPVIYARQDESQAGLAGSHIPPGQREIFKTKFIICSKGPTEKEECSLVLFVTPPRPRGAGRDKCKEPALFAT